MTKFQLWYEKHSSTGKTQENKVIFTTDNMFGILFRANPQLTRSLMRSQRKYRYHQSRNSLFIMQRWQLPGVSSVLRDFSHLGSWSEGEAGPGDPRGHSSSTSSATVLVLPPCREEWQQHTIISGEMVWSCSWRGPFVPTSKQGVESRVASSGIAWTNAMISHPVPTVATSYHRHDTDLALPSPHIWQICV